MKIRNLIRTGLMVAGFATMAQAQSYYGGGYAPEPVGRDQYQRHAAVARIEADRREVEHERWELNHSRWFEERREAQELRAARERLEHDRREFGRMRYQDRY